MSLPWKHATVWLVLAAGLTTGCGSRKEDPSASDPSLSRELHLLTEAIRTVHERYVDQDRATVDQLISNSLSGLVASIDPYATLEAVGATTREPPDIPEDVALAEAFTREGSNIATIRIYGFVPAARRDLKNIENSLRAKPFNSILLDTRGAHGNDYGIAALVAEWFLPQDEVIGSVVEKQGARRRVFSSRRPPLWGAEVPLVMLIDRHTSGPSEMLAAALRFHHRAHLVGEATAGKTVLQERITLDDQWSLWLTTGRVTDPNGKDITGNPLQPDLSAETGVENIDRIQLEGLRLLQEQN